MGDRTEFDVGYYNDVELLAYMDLYGNTDHHDNLTKDMIIGSKQFGEKVFEFNMEPRQLLA